MEPIINMDRPEDKPEAKKVDIKKRQKKIYSLIILAFIMFFLVSFLFLRESGITAHAVSGNETIGNLTGSGQDGLAGKGVFFSTQLIFVSILAVIILAAAQVFSFFSFGRHGRYVGHIAELDEYLKRSLLSGKKAEDILQYLLLQGWTKKVVAKRLSLLQKHLEKKKEQDGVVDEKT